MPPVADPASCKKNRALPTLKRRIATTGSVALGAGTGEKAPVMGEALDWVSNTVTPSATSADSRRTKTAWPRRTASVISTNPSTVYGIAPCDRAVDAIFSNHGTSSVALCEPPAFVVAARCRKNRPMCCTPFALLTHVPVVATSTCDAVPTCDEHLQRVIHCPMGAARCSYLNVVLHLLLVTCWPPLGHFESDGLMPNCHSAEPHVARSPVPFTRSRRQYPSSAFGTSAQSTEEFSASDLS